jgi:Sec-independent protein translocase protein TatA
MVLIAVVAVLVFGKDLPQAASKAYLQVRKLRGAVDDLRRESGIDQEIRNIERTVREAEWEARRTETEARKLTPPAPVSRIPRPPAGSSAENAGTSEVIASPTEPSTGQPPAASATDDAAS